MKLKQREAEWNKEAFAEDMADFTWDLGDKTIFTIDPSSSPFTHIFNKMATTSNTYTFQWEEK